MTGRRFRGVLLAAALVFAQVPAAFAQGLTVTEEEARSRLIEEAKKAHGVGRHEEALALVRRAAALKLTPSLRYFLAFEQEELGLFAEAYANAKQCAGDFQSDAALPQRDEYLKTCTGLRDRLAGKVAYVVLTVPRMVPGLVVTVAGTEVKPELFGLPYLVNPRSTPIEATAPDHKPRREVIEPGPGQKIQVELSLNPATPPPTGAAAPIARSQPPVVSTPAATGPQEPPPVGFSALAAALYLPEEGGGSGVLILEAGVRLVGLRRELRLHVLGGRSSGGFETAVERSSSSGILAGLSAAPIFFVTPWLGLGAHASAIFSFQEASTSFKDGAAAAGFRAGTTTSATATIPILNLLALVSLRPGGPAALFDFGLAFGLSKQFSARDVSQYGDPPIEWRQPGLLALLWAGVHP